jgi:hypothetical protein
MVAWWIAFLICLSFPPLLALYALAALIRLGRVVTHRRYRREVAWRDRDTPPRGYNSGEALRKNRRQS